MSRAAPRLHTRHTHLPSQTARLDPGGNGTARRAQEEEGTQYRRVSGTQRRAAGAKWQSPRKARLPPNMFVVRAASPGRCLLLLVLQARCATQRSARGPVHSGLGHGLGWI